jgi:tRNA-splicing ligase RtcB (3'-phosphate/5'-hydroxy nucleic acid ligase)
MTDPSLPPIRMWLTAPLGHQVTEALGHLQRAPDVQQIAVMPDVHLANDICVGVVLATSGSGWRHRLRNACSGSKLHRRTVA